MARFERFETIHIFEIRCNADLVSGAAILKELTGARILHGPNPAGPVDYAETAREGDEFEIGQLTIGGWKRREAQTITSPSFSATLPIPMARSASSPKTPCSSAS